MIAAAVSQPQVGDISDARPGTSFRGWLISGEGIEGEQPYVYFRNGRREYIALTETLVTNRNQNSLVWKIKSITEVIARPGDELIFGAQCNSIDLSPQLVVFNRRTGMATGYFGLPV